MVPAWRMGSDAKRSQTSRKVGHSVAKVDQACSRLAAAPMWMWVGSTCTVRNSATPPMAINSPRLRNCLVTHSPMSVLPASTLASGLASRSAANCASVRGAWKWPSLVSGVSWARARKACSIGSRAKVCAGAANIC